MEKDRRIFGWLMYDWANSAFITTVGVAVLPAYFAASVAKGGWVFMGTRFGATSLWGYTVGLAGLVVFLLAPFFGALADQADRKKLFLTVLCLLGSLLSFLLVFSGPGRVVYTLALFAGAQICFVGGNIFYDAFLPHLARKGDMDRISGKGFAYGYVGGGLQFALSLGLVAGHGFLGISQDLAARLAMAMAGLWWGGFGIMALSRLEETGPRLKNPP